MALELKIANKAIENKPRSKQLTKFVPHPRITFFSKGSKLTTKKLENKAWRESESTREWDLMDYQLEKWSNN